MRTSPDPEPQPRTPLLRNGEGLLSVTLHTDRARVTRRKPLQLIAGEQTIIVADLPPSIDESSIRASGRGEGVRIIGVEVKRLHRLREKEGEPAELRRELQDCEDKKAELVDAEKAEEGQQTFLERLGESAGRNLTRGIASGTATIESAQALADFLAFSLNASHKRSRRIARKHRKLEKRIQAIRLRLQEYGREEQLERREALVIVEADTACDAELEITYVAYGASWSPHYEVRLIDDHMELHYLATIRQRTGEQWNDVALALSTASPRVSTDLPELDPWYIDRLRPVVAFEGVPRGMMMGSVPAPQAMVAEAPPAPSAPPVESRVESDGIAVTYHVARPITVPPDDTLARVTIAHVKLTPRLDYLTIPRIDEGVYLRATVVNESSLLLLPGEISIFHGGDYIGKGNSGRIAPGEEFELQLGADDRVKVERKLASRRASKTLIGSTRRIDLSYEITLANLLPRPAQVTLQDQLPVPRHESIKVKPGEMTPPPDTTTDLGIMTWSLLLAPGERRSIAFAFAVEHPKDITLEL